MAGPHTLGRILVLPMILLWTLAGCTQWPQARYPVTVQTPGALALIKFESSDMAQARTVRVSHLDAFEHVEYARYETDALTLEVIYDTSLSDGLVLDYPYWMKRMVDTWNFNRSQGKEWGASSSVTAWHGTVDYTFYRLGDSQRDCAGFNSEWDYDPRDPFGRPVRVLFGYLCAAPGKTLTQPQVTDVLASVTLSGRLGESFVKPGTRAYTDQVAFAMARGSDGSTSGNAEFPFNFGTPYFEGDDSEDFDD